MGVGVEVHSGEELGTQPPTRIATDNILPSQTPSTKKSVTELSVETKIDRDRLETE